MHIKKELIKSVYGVALKTARKSRDMYFKQRVYSSYVTGMRKAAEKNTARQCVRTGSASDAARRVSGSSLQAPVIT